MSNKYIYQLSHNYIREDEDSVDEEDRKFLGIYSSKLEAKKAIERYHKLPGFDRYPIDCFLVGKRKLNEDSAWTDGFITV